jgi:hypothetical protein
MSTFKTLFLFCAIISSHLSKADFYNVGILPASPTVLDTIRLYYHTESANSPTWLMGISKNCGGNIIYMDVCWRQGQINAGDNLRDTIDVGVLPAGNYSVILRLHYTSAPLDSNCQDGSVYYDSTTLSLSVAAINTTINSNTITSFSLTPNPASSYLTISISEEHIGSTFTLADLTGRVALKSEITNPKSEISIASLPSGIYLAVLTTPSGQRAVKKVVKE